MKPRTWILELRREPAPGLMDANLLGRPYATALKVLCLVVIVLVPLLQSFRGLDVTDTGFVATNQRFIFSDPASVSYWFHLWLTNVLGGLVDLVFGAWGLLPMKLAAAVIFWGTAAAAFKIFRTAMPPALVWISVAVTIVFSFVEKINLVHYNNLSVLFMGLGAWLILDGCITKRRGLLFAAGVFLGMNVLVRVPNAAALGLILVPAVLDLLGRGRAGRLRPDWSGMLLFAAGVLSALLAGFAVMAVLGHLGLYLASLRDLGSSTVTEGSNYRASRVFTRPLRDGFFALVSGTVSLGVVVALSAAFSLPRSRGVRLGLVAILGTVLCVVFFLGLYPSPAGSTTFRAVAGIGYLAALAASLFLTSASDIRLRLGTALAAVVVIALSIGSDTGIKVSTYAFVFLVPGTLGVLTRMSGALSRITGRRALDLSAAVIAAVLGALSVFGIAQGIYRDTSAMLRNVNHPQLAGVFTSPARAKAFEEALPVISAHAPPGSELLAFDSIGLVHFVTRTKPYLDNPWPALYSRKDLEQRLAEREKLDHLPVVVLVKHNPRSSAWPLNSSLPVSMDIVEAFITRNGYHLNWENDAFSVFLPKDTP